MRCQKLRHQITQVTDGRELKHPKGLQRNAFEESGKTRAGSGF